MKRLLILIVLLALVSQPALAQETVTLTVSVVNPAGEPVQGAELTANWDGKSATATTASNGKAFIDVPAGQEVAIETKHDTYVRNKPFLITATQEETAEIDMYPKASAVIEVSDSNEMVDAAKVVVRKHGKIAAAGKTNENGVFETGVIEEGEYTVSIVKPGYYRKHVDMKAVGDVEKNATIEQGSVTVAFNTIDGHFEEQKLVKNAEVQISGIGSLKTQDNGRVAMNLPVNSKYELTVNKEGYDEVHTQVKIGEQPKEANFTLERTPGIFLETVNQKIVVGERSRVMITNAYGEPVEGATLFLDGDKVGETNENGVFMVPIEAEGNHTIRATSGNLQSESVSIKAFTTVSEKQQNAEQQQSTSILDIGITLIKQLFESLKASLG